MGILADWQIRGLGQQGLIKPFHEGPCPAGTISYGLSHYGYDLRLGRTFKVFTNALGNVIVDPKHFDARSFVDLEGDECIIPPNSFALAESLEYFIIPRDLQCIILGKSTYARCGIVVNCTPLEPCLSEDSDVLTRAGWVPIGLVGVGDEVLTRRADGTAEYREVERKQEYHYQGELLHFRGRSVDQLVTPDHKLAVWHRDPRRGREWRLQEAGSVYGRHNYSFDRAVAWGGTPLGDRVAAGDRSWPTLPFLRFLGCWLGDGSAYRGTDRGHHIKLAVVSKERKRDLFREVLAALGIQAREGERGFEFFDKGLALWLRRFGHAADKYIERRFLDATPAELEVLWQGLLGSDGTALTDTYTTASRRLADDVQEMAFKMGKAAIVRHVQERINGNPVNCYKVRVAGVHLRPKMGPARHGRLAYSGMVYDLTVPNHVFFMRRGGKASWTGNCWEGRVTLEISNTTPLPAKVYAGEGIGQVLYLRADDEPCQVSYQDKKGKYQYQAGLTLPKV